MKIFLTGHCGYVGQRLMPMLQEAGHTVQGCDLKWFYDDGSIERDVRHVTDIGDCDAIIHLAAIANDPSVDFYPRRSWETACLASMRLALAAVRAQARFIYASSVSVYGADRGMVTEDMDLRPLTDYNKTKMAAERVLLSYHQQYGMPLQIIRPATVCGLSPRMRLDLSVNTMTSQALANGVMTVHGGDQWRPSIHIDDLCRLYLFMLHNPDLQGIYNAGFENNSLMDIAKRVRDLVGADIKVLDKKDNRSYMVNSDKLLATGFRAQKSMDHAIYELRDAWRAGKLRDEPRWYNLGWMNYLEIQDK